MILTPITSSQPGRKKAPQFAAFLLSGRCRALRVVKLFSSRKMLVFPRSIPLERALYCASVARETVQESACLFVRLRGAPPFPRVSRKSNKLMAALINPSQFLLPSCSLCFVLATRGGWQSCLRAPALRESFVGLSRRGGVRTGTRDFGKILQNKYAHRSEYIPLCA